MSCIIKQKRKGSDIVYAYESTSVWIPGKGPRSKRRLLGRVDPETGEIVPTGKRGRRKKETAQPEPSDSDSATAAVSDLDKVKQELIEVVSRNQSLETSLAELRDENRVLRSEIQKLNAQTRRMGKCLENAKSSILKNLDSCINTCKTGGDSADELSM